jgi:hypothetical protein
MSFQPDNDPSWWHDLARSAKEAAGWRCAGCGAMHGSLAVSRRNCLYRVALAACNLDHDRTHPTPRLAVYCQACHLRYDTFQRWRSRRRHAHLRAILAGQLALPEQEACE